MEIKQKQSKIIKMSNRRKIDNKNGENVQNYNNNAENVEKLQKKLMELEEDTQNVYNRTKDYKKNRNNGSYNKCK